MANVAVRTGAIEALHFAERVPQKDWRMLVLARRSFCSLKIPHDCRELLRFVKEAETLEMWKVMGYASLDDFLRRGYEIDPELVSWAVEGLRSLSPDEPIPLLKAVEKGKQAAALMQKTKPMAEYGTNQFTEGGGYNVTSLERGNRAPYLAARLKRDHPGIAAAVERGEYPSIRAAALDAGIVRRTFQIPVDPEGAAKLIRKHFTEDEVRALREALGVARRKPMGSV